MMMHGFEMHSDVDDAIQMSVVVGTDDEVESDYEDAAWMEGKLDESSLEILQMYDVNMSMRSLRD